ncbi:MAG: hypothetical protein ACE37L_12100 [Allomuricauda sp.]
MKALKIRFKKKRLYANLIIGVIWLVFAVIILFTEFTEEENHWMIYVYPIIGFLYLGQYWYDSTFQYLIIDDNTIQRNIFYGTNRKIALKDITWIKKIAGDYILKSDKKDMHIDLRLIDESSLDELNKVLANLNLPADKTPFPSAF